MSSPPNDLSLDELESRGVDYLAKREYAGAESVLRQAIALGANRASVHLRLGLALAAQGKLVKATAELNAAAAMAPADPEILLHLGIVLSSRGQHAEAEAAFREAAVADPFNPGQYLNLGNALAAQGKAEEALASYRKVLALKPDLAAAHYNAGTQLKRMDRLDEAAEAYLAALALEPGYVDAHNNLGVVYQRQARLGDAALSYRSALAIDPDHREAQNNLGTVLRAQEQIEQAVALYERAIQLYPDDPHAYINLGDARTDQGRYPEAQALYEKALSLDPGNALAHGNLGNALSAQHLWDQSIAQYRHALQLDPTLSDTQYNLGLAQLFCLELESGWPAYERRLQCPEVRKGLRKGAETLDLYDRLPHWRGPAEANAGKVAIWAEQGIGDQVLFSTLIPDLVATGVPFLYEVDERLLNAYERAFPGVQFVPLEKPPRRALQAADRVLLAGSLPGLFRTSRESFAHQPKKLLSAPPQRVVHYRDRLSALGPGLRVAFSWKSKHRRVRLGPEKSHALTTFAPLLKQAGAHFVDVQYGDTATERVAVAEAEGVRLLHFDEVDFYNDLEEVLAILEACDLLITTSNATAHFAGALGKRTWLLYLADRAPFYYWAHGGSHRSLWYPSVEIVTGRHFTEWAPLIGQVATRLSREPATFT